ncbi:MAG: hypothetical protein RMY34_08140 [Aulosira sp. DedQUE10]|nr:hypothetical protein [Aulosira sp. DedQUE10]
MQSNHVVQVDFSEKELIILYNYIPRLIEKCAILVNLSSNYYTSAKQEILLTEDNRGNYWIIATDYDIFCLFPVAKLNGKINPRVNEAFNLLFEFQNYENSDIREFILKKPAKVYPARSREGWILEEAGFVDFTNSSLLSVEALNGKVNKSPLIPENLIRQVSRKEFEEYINKFETEINQLKAQVQHLTEAQEEIQTKMAEINNKHSNLETQLPLTEGNSSYSNYQVETTQQETTSNQDNSINIFTRLNLTPEELLIVETYNSNPVIISQKAKQVSETNSSIEKRREGSNEAIVIEKQPQGYYWLVGRDTLYLVPRRGFNINRSTVDTFKALFKCQGSKVTSKFKLIKPAKVVMIGNSSNWQLIERGIIEFE